MTTTEPEKGHTQHRVEHQFHWPAFDAVIEAERRLRSDAVCLQVGANDGQLVDPLFRHICEGLSAHLVEPHPEYFAKVTSLHAERPWVTTDQVAVGSVAELARPLYYLTDTDVLMTNCGDGVASFYREHVTRFCALEGVDIVRHLRSVPVPVVTYSDLLQRKGDGFRPDILVVDIEGEDAALLNQMFELDGPLPDVVMYEHSHLDMDTATSLRARFAASGYALVAIKDETLAYRS